MVKNFKSKRDKRQRQIASVNYLKEVAVLLNSDDPTEADLASVHFSREEFECHFKERAHFQKCANDYETYDFAVSVL